MQVIPSHIHSDSKTVGRHSHRKDSAFTMVELMVTLAIVGILLVLCIVAYQSTIQRRHQATCQSNLRQIALAINMYATDNDGCFPPLAVINAAQPAGITYLQLLMLSPKGKLSDQLQCPLAEVKEDNLKNNPHQLVRWDLSGYALNAHLNEKRSMDDHLHKRGAFAGKHDSVVTSPSLTVLVMDARAGIYGAYFPDTQANFKKYDETGDFGHYPLSHGVEIAQNSPGATRHNGASEYLFVDGHSSHLRPEQIDAIGAKKSNMPHFEP